MKRHSLVIPASERREYPEDAYSHLDFASPPYLEWSGRGRTLYWWAELDQLHSMTRAHPPLVYHSQKITPASPLFQYRKQDQYSSSTVSDPRGRTRVPRAYEIGKSRKLSSDFLDVPIVFDYLIAGG